MTTLDTIIEHQRLLVAAQSLNARERRELVQAREELAMLRGKLDAVEAARGALEGTPAADLGGSMAAIVEAMAASYIPSKPEDKTIGFKMPEDLRTQLTEFVETFQAKSYKHLVLACVRLGVMQLKNATSSLPDPQDGTLS